MALLRPGDKRRDPPTTRIMTCTVTADGGGALAEATTDAPQAATVLAGLSGGLSAARPQLIRALNEQLLLGHIRASGPCSRADLARISGLSKPTVSQALANVERSGLLRIA